MPGRVVVIGSLSQDLVIKAPRRPGRGETIRGTDFGMFVGGKGNNQALAAARAGASVAMVGRVGKDEFGTNIIESLVKAGVDVKRVIRDSQVGTGIAVITVGGDGDNSIVIAQQANLKLSVEDVMQAEWLIKRADIVLLQLEVPMETILAAAKLCNDLGVKVALNPAPAPEDGKLPAKLVRYLDYIIPNQTEAMQLTGVDVSAWRKAPAAGQALRKLGAKAAVITLGENGAFVSSDSRELYVDSFPVTVVDTTAAGDAFCGAWAAALANGSPVADAVRYGCAAGALACTTLGAEPSLPTRERILKLLQSRVSI